MPNKWGKYVVSPEATKANKWSKYLVGGKDVSAQKPFQFGGGAGRRAGVGGEFEALTGLEKKIAKRPDLMDALWQELKYIPGMTEKSRKQPLKVFRDIALKNPTIAMKALGGLSQRGFAGLSNVLMQIQKGDISPVSLAREARKGLTGERLGELGDIPRQIGVPEPISATIGLFASMGIGNIATKGKLISSASKATKFAASKLPRTMNKNYLVNRAKLASSGLDDLYEGLSQEYDDMYNAIGNRTVDISKVQEIADDLPKAIVSKVNKSNLIRKMPDGSVAPTLNNMKVIKNIIRKAVPKNVLSGRQQADIFQGNLKYNLERVKDVMAEGNPELTALNQRYRNFMQLRAEVGNIVWDKFGNPKSAGLASLYKPGAERAKQLSMEKFSRLWPQAQQIIKDAEKYTRRQTFKRIAGRAALVGGGYELGRRALRPLFEGIGGGAGIEPTGP